MKSLRKPTPPGEILSEEFLKPLNLTQKKLADHLQVDIKVINRLVNSNTRITPEMAVKLAAAFNCSPEFWLNAQNAVDLYEIRKHFDKTAIRPISRAKNGRNRAA